MADDDVDPRLSALDAAPAPGPRSVVAGPGAGLDVFATARGSALSEAEAGYAAAARSANTLRGYRADWAHFTAWAAARGLCALPAEAEAITGYLVELAAAGRTVGTMSRRLSAIKAVHRLSDHPDPTSGARVVAIWEGIRRTHAAPPVQSAALMPPLLFDVLDACPSVRTWRDGRPPQVDLGGLRDRALLLVAFVAALRRSEIAALDAADVVEHPNGLVLSITRSKGNQAPTAVELAVLPRAANPVRCPVAALTAWRQAAGIEEGPLLRAVGRDNHAKDRRMHPESINAVVQGAIARAGIDPGPYSAHSLRAGFVTYAHLRGASDRAIAHQSRHRSLSSVGTYVRIHSAWADNAATTLGL